MTTATSNLLPDTSVTANFRAWAQFIHNALSGAGWVNTADTGQINLTTVTGTSSLNTSQGYEIWTSNDGVSPTIYMKIEYGSGAAAGRPGMWLTFGTSSNGSGTLTGQTSSRQVIASQSTSTTVNQVCVAAGGTGWFSCGMFGAATLTFGFTVERVKTNTGGESTVGFVYHLFNTASGSALTQFILATGTSPGVITNVYTATASGTKVVGATVGIIQFFPVTVQLSYAAGITLVGLNSGDIGANTTYTLSRYGTTHTYYVLASAAFNDQAATTWALCLRYE